MTLIAQAFVRGAPIIVGDVLLSSERKTGLRTNLPLVGDINQVLASQGQPFEVVCLVQKVNILSDRLVIAWSGLLEQAERAARVLSDISSRPGLTVADITMELNAIDRDRIDQLKMFGWLVTDICGDTITASSFSVRVGATEVPGVGTVYAAGSGAKDFIRLLEATDWTVGGAANEIQVAQAILGHLVNMEYRRGGTIENRWGGGFEAVTFAADAGRFQKVGDTLHTFWAVDVRSPDKAQFPMFYKTTYWRDALIIRYARFASVTGRDFQLKMNSLELIPPLLKEANEYDLEELGPVDFSHKVLCCHVSVERSDGRDVMQIIRPSPDATVELDFHGTDGSGRLHVPGQLSKMIIEGALEETRTRASRLDCAPGCEG